MATIKLLVLCFMAGQISSSGTNISNVGVLQEKEVTAICDGVQQYAGFFKLSTGDKNYFYWFFESRHQPSTDPVLLWMTGGPGCSSLVALFGENGPCKVNTDGTDTIKNPYSWNNNASVIYIDQPTGTGFSYGLGYDSSEAEVAADMYDFLQLFFQAHPKYLKPEFFIFGESYAGHYVPATAHQVWLGNKANATGTAHINLKGVAIGNGLTDPEIQYAYYPDMAVSTNGHAAAVSSFTHAAMEAVVPECVSAIHSCNQNTTGACTMAYEMCNIGLIEPYQLTGMNPYDMREECAVPPLCYDFSNVATYLTQPNVIDALGVTGHSWEDCNKAVTILFAGDWMKNYQTMLPDMLADGIRVMLYVGDQDFICNWLGNKAWAVAMEWPGKAAFNAAADEPWYWNSTKEFEAGLLRTADGFSFLQVHAAGHMVPMNQPEAALALANSFMAGKI